MIIFYIYFIFILYIYLYILFNKGDTIVSIDNDDCSHWFLSRVKARLSNYRVPIGGHVRFVFERRIKNGDGKIN